MRSRDIAALQLACAMHHGAGMRDNFDPYEGWEDEVTDTFRRPRPRVLVAEDDQQLRRMVVARLQRDGYDVLEARSGHEALAVMKVIAEHEIDDLVLAIMDVRMPGLSGLDVVYTLRAWQWELPILLITAYPDPEIVDTAKRLGVSLLAKPFAFPRLDIAAREAIAAHQEPEPS